MVTAAADVALRVVLAAASILCVGGLFHGAFLRTRAGHGRLTTDASDWAVVRWSSLAWALAALLLVPVAVARGAGVSVFDLGRSGVIAHAFTHSGLPLAWSVVFLVAGFVCVASRISHTWAALVGLLIVACVAVVCPPLGSQALVGPNHDFGADATILAMPAATILIGSVVMIALHARRGTVLPERTLTRFRDTSAWCWAVAAAGLCVICWFELAGTPILGTATGWLFVVQFAALAGMALIALPALRWHTDGSARRLGHESRLVPLVALSAVYVAAGIARTQVTPPQYHVPTTVMQSFFGYTVTTPPTWLNLAIDWRLSILFTAIAVTASALYLVGVRRLHRRGDHWTPGRTVAWLFGWGVVVISTSSGLATHANATLSAQMGLHMAMNMFGPVLLVLGGPVTLALRATVAHPTSHDAGPHEWVNGLLNWDIARQAYSPLWVFVRFVGSYYLLYLTPIFGQAIRYHWARDAMNMEFILAGYMFFGLVIGVDHVPRPLPHIGRLGLTMAAMPIHGFFGVIVMMSSGTLIAGDFYRLIHAPLLTSLHADQGIAGAIAWSAGEIPLAFVAIVLALQWSAQDEREGKRTARAERAGHDDSYDAYNDMLAKLAARDQRDAEREAARDQAIGRMP